MAHRDPVAEAEHRLRRTELVLAALRRAHRDAELTALLTGASAPGPTEEDVVAGEVALIEARDACFEARYGISARPGGASAGAGGLFLLCLAGLLSFLAP